MNACSFSLVSPVEFGRLWIFQFREVAAWLLGVHGDPRPVTHHTSEPSEVIEASPDEAKSKACSSDLSAVPGEDKKFFCEEYEEHVGKGKVVKIPDMAFVT